MKPYMIHTVFFWVKEDTSKAKKESFEKGLSKLGTCPQIKSFHWGRPATTEERDVVENSYDYAISVQFDSLQLHDAYQAEPLHHEFIQNHEDIWEKVVVYDTEVGE